MDSPESNASSDSTTPLELHEQSRYSDGDRNHSQPLPVAFLELLHNYRRARFYSLPGLHNWWEACHDSGDHNKVTSPWWEELDDVDEDIKVASPCSAFTDGSSDDDSVPDDMFSDATFSDDSDDGFAIPSKPSSLLFLPVFVHRVYRSGWWEHVGCMRPCTPMSYSKFLDQGRLPSIAEE